ncbi:MAG: DUF11 domain-containing protein, partial [Leptolyngbya sp. SIO3F4]|nr:DUF11 domain-containing protein [Leptolyngbya sp. SIO3F4]
MKRWFIGLSFLTLVGTIPLIGGEPVRAQLLQVKDTIVESIFRPEVKLTLAAEKQIIEVNEKGQQEISWQTLEGRVTVQPGDTIRYILDGSNSGEVDATNLQITQPVPAKTIYKLASAQGNAQITYSIDGGQSFVAEPFVEITLPDGTVELKPAPAEAYTHMKWSFDESL